MADTNGAGITATAVERVGRYRWAVVAMLFAATAINLVRLHEWWTSSPLQSVRKASHLTRLGHALAA